MVLDGLTGQGIASVVVGVVAVALHLVEGHLVQSNQLQYFLPKL